MQKRAIGADDIAKLVLIAAILLGGWFRFMPPWLAGFPVNDGGLFYTMMRELQANHFIPPLYTSYNQLNIPFAYPPFALYAGAILSSMFNISGVEILRWLPALVNTLTIPVFYLLAKEILRESVKSSLSTLAYALTPHLTVWLSMGGGLTRSFGTLFMLLTAYFSYRMFAAGNGRYILATILFGSLTALSHTESTLFAIALPILFWLFVSRTVRGFKQGLIVAIGVLFLAGWWYALIVVRHGFDPLLSALKTGGQTPLVFLLLFNFRGITAESFLDLFGVAGFLGLALLTARRQYLIPVMYALIYLTQPRSAHTVVNIPLAMASGVLIADVILPNFKERIVALLSLASPLLLANLVYESYMLSLNRISPEELAAFQWVAENTPAESRFLVLTGEPLAFCDSTSEWFPALTGRHSITTAQGREWLDGENLNEFIRQKAEMERCLGEGVECAGAKAEYFGENQEYIYIANNKPVAFCDEWVGFIPTNQELINALDNLEIYSVVYRTESAIIIKRSESP